ncbi:MAG: S8 family serine peptidase [candidate division WOR-3 bacterium]
MKKSPFLLLALVLFSILSAGQLGPDLTRLITRTGTDELIPVTIVLTEQASTAGLNFNPRGLNKSARWERTVSRLKEFTRQSQQPLLAELNRLQSQDQVRAIEPFWILNAVHCHIKPTALNQLVARPDISFIEHSLIPSPSIMPLTPESRDALFHTSEPDVVLAQPGWHLRRIGVDSVWSRLGYTGDSIVVGMIDTGINYDHVDLAGRLWSDPNYPGCGWNFESNNGDPRDVVGHGTAVAGLIVGDGTSGETCGVAPGAKIMACRVRVQYDSLSEEQVFSALQFCVAPPLSPQNHADIINLGIGWQMAYEPRQAAWREIMINIDTIGIPVICAAGNDRTRPVPYSIRCPAHCPGPWHHPFEINGGRSAVITVGASNRKDTVTNFSSKGPVTWALIMPWLDYGMPPGLEKPDIVAPGESIRVCAHRQNSGYLTLSGTSLSGAIVSGIAALMLDKNGELLPAEVDSVLQMTALLRGRPPKNNDYGTGRVSAYGAVRAAPEWYERHDAAALEILAVPDTVDTNGVVVPQARIANRGNMPDVIPVVFRIGELYRDTTSIALAPREIGTVTFPPRSGFPRGQLAFCCSTALPNDEREENNRVLETRFIRVYDAAARSVDNPWQGESIELYVTVPPMGTVAGVGNTDLDSVRVQFLFSFKPDYSDTFWLGDTVVYDVEVGDTTVVVWDLVQLTRLGDMYALLIVRADQEWGTGFPPVLGNPLNDTAGCHFLVVPASGLAQDIQLKPKLRKVLPTVSRAPFDAAALPQDLAIYDALGRRMHGKLGPGIYYLQNSSTSHPRKLIVSN